MKRLSVILFSSLLLVILSTNIQASGLYIFGLSSGADIARTKDIQITCDQEDCLSATEEVGGWVYSIAPPPIQVVLTVGYLAADLATLPITIPYQILDMTVFKKKVAINSANF